MYLKNIPAISISYFFRNCCIAISYRYLKTYPCFFRMQLHLHACLREQKNCVHSISTKEYCAVYYYFVGLCKIGLWCISVCIRKHYL